MHVLIVDDDEDIRQVVTMILEADGHHVEQAVDGMDALEKLASGSHPALILLDMMMPRVDGETFMQLRKRTPALAAIPVVIISGHQTARQKAAELGAVHSLVKPVELEELLAVVRAVAPSSELAAP